MSLIHIGMDTDKFEKDFFVLHCTRLQERIAELEKEKTALFLVCQKVKSIAFDTTVTDEIAISNLIYMLNSNIDIVSPKPKANELEQDDE